MKPMLLFWAALLWALPALAAGPSEALRSAATTLARSGLQTHSSKTIFIKVVNRHSQLPDSKAQEIQVWARKALVEALPDFKLVVLEESLAGVNLNRAVQLKGEYEQQGAQVTVRFTALDGVQGSVLAQARAIFTEAGRDRQLMAILDLEAPELSANHRKAYSEILKSAIAATGAFQLASSADVDRMNADAIQKVYQCTRDECATIIGEQLGVDRVLATSLIRMSKTQYLLSAKIMDIQDGRIEKQATLQHKGGLESLDRSLGELAAKLTGGKVPQPVLGKGNAQIHVKSEPSGGEIFLDGIPLNRKTPSLLKDLPSGQHKIAVMRDDRGASQVLELEDGGLAKVSLTLTDQLDSEVLLFSQPFEATVYLDGNRLGTTPLKQNISAGQHRLRLTLSGYAPVEREIRVKPFERNEFQFKLLPGRDVILEVKPANAQVKMDGDVLLPGGPESVADLDRAAAHRKFLGQGLRRFEVSHPGAAQPLYREIDILSEGQTERFDLPISPAYRKKLEYSEAMESWEWSWKVPLYLSATGALLSAYSYQLATQAWAEQSSAEDSRDQAWSQHQSATSVEDAFRYQQEAQTYHESAVAQSQKAEQQYQIAQTAGAVGVVAAGLALWFWAGEPDPPGQVSLTPPLPGRSAQLNYSWRW
ncbi:MAG: PEGA domain-containing protein [bacterium]|nr:PEGA domain-containing protein [bacterium]